MERILKTEELAQFVLGIYLFSQLNFAWWWFLVLILTPDIGMVGYMMNRKTGALVYNIFHNKALGILLLLLGIFYLGSIFSLIGVIIFSHAAMDRMFGFGLKYPDGFHNTHLGKIGNKK